MRCRSRRPKTGWPPARTSSPTRRPIALNVTKQGLTSFLCTELQNLHAVVGRSCGHCSIDKLKPCPTNPYCNKKKGSNCPFHKSQTPQPCPTCDNVKQNIILQHRYGRPSWRNTRAENWALNNWEIGKCYLPPDGYSSISSVQESDFNGVISIMLNCLHFQTCLSSYCLSPPPPDNQCPLEKVRQIGRDIRHTSHCKVTDGDLQDYFQTLSTLLADPNCLQNDPTATIACTRLNDLQNDRMLMEELGELFKEANKTLKHAKEAGERFSEEAETTLAKALNAIQFGEQCIQKKTKVGEQRLKSQTHAVQQRLKRRTKIGEQRLEIKEHLGEERLESKIHLGVERIESNTQRGEECLESKANTGGERVESKTQRGEERLESKAHTGEELLESKAQRGEERLESKAHTGEERLESKTHTGEERLESKTQRGEERLESKAHTGEERLESKTQRGEERLESKTHLGEERLESNTQRGEERLESKAHSTEKRLERKTQLGEQRIESKTHDAEQYLESKIQDVTLRIEYTVQDGFMRMQQATGKLHKKTTREE